MTAKLIQGYEVVIAADGAEGVAVAVRAGKDDNAKFHSRPVFDFSMSRRKSWNHR